MAYRRRMTRKKSRKAFKRGTQVHSKNLGRDRPKRGGIRL